jgi:trehalose/maltose transport system permease protein
MSVTTAPATQIARKKRRWAFQAPDSAIGRAQERLAWMLILPSLVVVAVVAFYPLFETFRLSFTNERLGSTREVRYVGFENYRQLLDDDLFRSAFWHTVQFTFFSVAFETILGIIIALTINSSFQGRGIVRASMLVPWAIPTVVSSRMWEWMYNDVYGVVNDILVNKLHILDEKVAWMANPNVSLPAIIAVDIWKTTPFMALLLLAGLQIIPNDVYEASTIDGASKWQQFWQITLPLLRPALVVALIFRTLDAFRVFDIVYVMKGAATDTITLAVYAQNFMIDRQRIGYGSAASVIIFLLIAMMVFAYVRIVKVEVE